MKYIKTYEEKKPNIEELLDFADRVLSGNGIADSLKIGDIVKYKSSINTYIVEIIKTIRHSPKNKKVDLIEFKTLLYHKKGDSKWLFVKEPQIMLVDRDTANYVLYNLTENEITDEINSMLDEIKIKHNTKKYNL